jgi:hypothetical protein
MKFWNGTIMGVLFALRVVAEECTLSEGGSDSFEVGKVVEEEFVCTPTGDDSLTFAMVLSEANLGRPAASAQTNDFLIMDPSCKVLGLYHNPVCGVPWTLRAEYLHHVLTITRVFMDVGQPEFTFKYANGLYKNGEDHCDCKSLGWARVGCKCAFPIDGEPE